MFEPMPQAAVNAMLQQVYPLEGEILYDLGCGDGRILIEAVESFSCRAVGIEINPETAALARENIEESGLGRMLVVQGNVKDYSLEDADVITMFLFPELMEEILPNIKPGTRVVSFEHAIPGVDCTERTATVGDTEYTFYTWVKDPQRTVEYTRPVAAQAAPVRPFSLVR
jgi:SAM-dependent methyltransferase